MYWEPFVEKKPIKQIDDDPPIEIKGKRRKYRDSPSIGEDE
jgi:hypothetical protein